mmetsp:Transcript_32790/g.78314  ORF Transcript_32790/g.78314 Transcript_32790/m.78314 type:complete len:139 (-) Transcript_32790:91-507(-)
MVSTDVCFLASTSGMGMIVERGILLNAIYYCRIRSTASSSILQLVQRLLCMYYWRRGAVELRSRPPRGMSIRRQSPPQSPAVSVPTASCNLLKEDPSPPGQEELAGGTTLVVAWKIQCRPINTDGFRLLRRRLLRMNL